jgi:hypothetical protein
MSPKKQSAPITTSKAGINKLKKTATIELDS